MEAPRHLLEIIQKVKPKAALFTTYTFSVSYFDSVFVPVLRSVGCNDIAVLVDATEAASGTVETSRAAGRIYRVAPVVAPGGGVFHPKIAYFMSEGHDVLAVASGNLTASGQSMQLESFDVVSADDAPLVFRDLAEWMEKLASKCAATSFQASQLLSDAARHSNLAFQRNTATPPPAGLPSPRLVHTQAGPARATLEAIFQSEAQNARKITVLSPFHSPDGGAVLRLAGSLGTDSLLIGIDGRRSPPVAPFDAAHFEGGESVAFVIPDVEHPSKPLHAKIFELEAQDKVLVMSGSINATSQSFETTRNEEISLARWLRTSPFSWKPVVPELFAPTQYASDFQQPHSLYVDAWVSSDRMLGGRVFARKAGSCQIQLETSSHEKVFFSTSTRIADDGSFSIGPLPEFESEDSLLLKVEKDGLLASCWLNLDEELENTAEERDRRTALARVLRGEFASEDIATVLRMFSFIATSIARGAHVEKASSDGGVDPAALAEFSYLRWTRSGKQRKGAALLGRDPGDILRMLNRWMSSGGGRTHDSGGDTLPPHEGPADICLQGVPAGSNGTREKADPYEVLDELCQLVPVALERQPAGEYSGILAEIVAARTVDRVIRQKLGGAPCVSWLERFSKFTYSDEERVDLGAVAAALACLALHELGQTVQKVQLSMLREAVERIAGTRLSALQWQELSIRGMQREFLGNLGEAARGDVLQNHRQIAAAETIDDCLLVELPGLLARRRRNGIKLLRGVMNEQLLDRRACPLCYLQLNGQEVSALRQKHMIVHETPTCNELLFFSEESEQLALRIKEIIDA